VKFLNIDEATVLREEILATREVSNENAIALTPDSGDRYKLQIDSCMHVVSLACIKPIADKHNLAIHYDPSKDLLTIYKPRKPKA
jgi:hypothetical protein